MIHEMLAVGPLECNFSVIGDETTHEAMVIDRGDDIDDILAIVERHKLQQSGYRRHESTGKSVSQPIHEHHIRALLHSFQHDFSGEMSKSRTSKSGGRLVNCHSAPRDR